jgi:hypothetical protein
MIAYHTDLVNPKENLSSIFFEKLCAWLDANGKYPDAEDDPVLHAWVRIQRHLYKAGQLEEDTIHKLNSIGFIWNLKEAEWYDKAFRVKKLLKEDQAAFFSGRSAHLFRWLEENITHLRKNAMHAAKIPLIKEIEALLSAANLPATIRGTTKRVKMECLWMANYNDLIEFRNTNSTRWPRLATTCKTERRLANWCYAIRYQYKRNTLSKDWITKLEAIKFNFNSNAKQH